MISVVIPMYNEEAIIADSMKRLCGYLDSRFGQDYEVICVGDGCTDGTLDALDGARRELLRLRVISYPDNRGKGSAIREGIIASRGDVVLYTDSDLAYGTSIIGDMAQALASSGADAVIGSRNISRDGYEGYTFLRRLASKLYIRVLMLAAGFRHSDSQCGIKCFRGDVARRVFALCKINSFAFDLEALMIAEHFGYRITEHPVKVINHRESASKVHLVGDTVKMLRDIRGIKKRIAGLRSEIASR